MEIKDLQAKVTAAAEKVEKIKVTIAKHEAAAANKFEALAKLFGITAENIAEKYNNGNYALRFSVSEYEQKRDDAKSAGRKLRDAEAILANWQAKLDKEVEKERFLSNEAPAVIIDFLNRWKEMARDWHIEGHKRYVELKPIIKDLKAEAEDAYRSANPGARNYGREFDKFMKEQKELNTARRELAMLGAVVASMATYHDETERAAYLENVLETDRKAKMFDLINRVNEVVGKITDASYLDINGKGNLDGIVIGEKGRAHVSTIGVGGYNIVCFHYRTNVYELKEKAPAAPAPAVEEAPAPAKAPVDESNAQASFIMEVAPTSAIHGKLGQQLYMDI